MIGKHPFTKRIHVFPALLALLCLTLMLVTACDKTTPGPEVPTIEDQKAQLLSQAETAWNSQEYATAETLYAQALNRPDLTAQEMALAWERYSLSAMALGKHDKALDGMIQWVRFIPEGRASTAWQDAYLQAISGLHDREARMIRLQSLAADNLNPWRLRAAAETMLAVFPLEDGDLQTALEKLDQIYAGADTAERKGWLEEALYISLGPVSSDNLEALGLILSEERKHGYPYTIVRLELARRLALLPGGWPEAHQILTELQALITNKGLIQRAMAAMERDKGQAAQGIILALPLTGQYQAFGWKIVQGANVARDELAKQGINMAVEVVNTDTPDWMETLRALPQEYRVVGGPLRMEVFDQILAGNIIGERVFFTFLRGLGGAQEGAQAWRFFPSREDQVDSLMDLAVDTFGMKGMAVLYPDEQFGKTMAGIFQDRAKARGAGVFTMQAYPKKDIAAWGPIVRSIVDSGAEAVFLPGDWIQAEILIPYFLYYNARSTMIMGTALWGQTLARKNFIAEDDFRRTVFPDTWWPERNSTATASLHLGLHEQGLGAPDFWNALGYDFVHFAARMGQVPQGWNAATINNLVQAAQNMEWAMAPIAWDNSGGAHQKLFLLKPSSGGFTEADINEMRQWLRR